MGSPTARATIEEQSGNLFCSGICEVISVFLSLYRTCQKEGRPTDQRESFSTHELFRPPSTSMAPQSLMAPNHTIPCFAAVLLRRSPRGCRSSGRACRRPRRGVDVVDHGHAVRTSGVRSLQMVVAAHDRHNDRPENHDAAGQDQQKGQQRGAVRSGGVDLGGGRQVRRRGQFGERQAGALS